MRILFSFLLIILSGCQYFGEGKVKSSAEVISLEKLKKVLRLEVSNTITDKHPRSGDYVSFVLQKTKVRIDSFTPLSKNKDQYHLKMHVVTINPAIREIILEIVGKLEGKKANAFNFSDALSMIAAQRKDLKVFIDQNFTLDIKEVGIRWVEL